MNRIKLFLHHRVFDQRLSVGGGGQIQKKKKPAGPNRQLELFSPVVITIMHPPDRRLELFFSGRNNNRAPPTHMSRSFY